MHEPLLARAALPAPTKVCGIPLRPYSLGHELLLVAEASPFLTGGGVFPGDLLTAIWICSSTFEGAKRSQNSWLYLPRLWLTKRMVAKACAKNLDRESAAFVEYREEGILELPLSDVMEPGEKTPRTPGSPYILRLHQFLVERLRKSEADAWDYPVGLAKIRWSTYYEEQHGLKVYNEDNVEMDRPDPEEGNPS